MLPPAAADLDARLRRLGMRVADTIDGDDGTVHVVTWSWASADGKLTVRVYAHLPTSTAQVGAGRAHHDRFVTDHAVQFTGEITVGDVAAVAAVAVPHGKPDDSEWESAALHPDPQASRWALSRPDCPERLRAAAALAR